MAEVLHPALEGQQGLDGVDKLLPLDKLAALDAVAQHVVVEVGQYGLAERDRIAARTDALRVVASLLPVVDIGGERHLLVVRHRTVDVLYGRGGIGQYLHVASTDIEYAIGFFHFHDFLSDVYQGFTIGLSLLPEEGCPPIFAGVKLYERDKRERDW